MIEYNRKVKQIFHRRITFDPCSYKVLWKLNPYRLPRKKKKAILKEILKAIGNNERLESLEDGSKRIHYSSWLTPDGCLHYTIVKNMD